MNAIIRLSATLLILIYTIRMTKLNDKVVLLFHVDGKHLTTQICIQVFMFLKIKNVIIVSR